ncbi:putative serine/threonine-protein kinase PBL3 [Bidens hawaiensis]|uniref:putative serine/threonine-protein kinase PBL3 n=1 Tax=Bidens hawaiensis TaxID=980011 RepID=UPI00404AAB3D
MDPEYLSTGKLTRGTDVYAFGVVLFELLSGRRAIDISRGEESALVRWAQRRMKERKLDQMVDANIRGTISSKCLGRFVKIADRCLLSDPKERPSMAEVATSLEDLLQVQKDWDNSEKTSVTTLFAWMIPMFIHRRTFPPTNPENDIDRVSSTKNELVARDLKVYTFDELRRATRGFSEGAYLGAWSYGDVYKGRVDKTTYSFSKSNKGMPVVIKSLSWNKNVKLEKAKLELENLKEFNHPNLVKLIGYCLSDKQLFLVNEVMPNGNFEDHLFSGAIARLPLVTKVKIAVGIARGIAFLHDARDYANPYLHCGGKSSMFRLDRRKILLDEDFTAKLSDCELTKLAHSHYPYNIRDDNGLVYGDYYPGFKPLQLQSNLDGFTLILVEVLTGKQISYDNEVQNMDDLLVQNGKMSIHNIAKSCFEICNEDDAELKMLILLEEHEMHIYDALATATAENCLM